MSKVNNWTLFNNKIHLKETQNILIKYLFINERNFQHVSKIGGKQKLTAIDGYRRIEVA